MAKLKLLMIEPGDDCEPATAEAGLEHRILTLHPESEINQINSKAKKVFDKPKKGFSQADCEPATAEVGSMRCNSDIVCSSCKPFIDSDSICSNQSIYLMETLHIC